MDHDVYSDEYLIDILQSVKRIALVGASPKDSRPSHHVMRFLLARGLEVIPVNPGHAGEKLHGQTVVAKLSDISGPLDMVDVFRTSDAVAGLVDEVLKLSSRPKVFWTQLGIEDRAAAAKAEAAGIKVVMNRCPAIEIPRLHL